MNLGGSTGLDKTIAYSGYVQLPDKFKLGQLSNVDMKIGGTFSKPPVSVDLAGTLKNLVTDTKAKVVGEATRQVNAAKDKAIEEAAKQKENALKAAQDQADRIRNEAQKLSDKLISDAQVQGDQLVDKAGNPITKKIAQAAAKKIMEEATRKAADINARADEQAKRVIQSAGGL